MLRMAWEMFASKCGEVNDSTGRDIWTLGDAISCMRGVQVDINLFVFHIGGEGK